MNTCKKQLVTRGALLLSFLFTSAPPAAAQPPTTQLPAFAELKDGWNTLTPGGETSCAVDANYRFFVRRAASDRVVVFFQGGGACMDGRSCDPERQPTSESEPAFRPTANMAPPPPGGIFDLTNPDNPFAEYSMVFVSYCTGDLHLGERDTSYTNEDARGKRQFVIKHRGQVNAMTALRWIYANFPAPRSIFVTGTSAGGYATPFYASLLARHYPRARVAGLGDAAGALRIPGSETDQRQGFQAPRGSWGLPDVLRRHGGWERYQGGSGVVSLYVTAAAAAPELGLFQVDHAHDQQQRLRHVVLFGDPNPDVFAALKANRREISASVPSFRSFTAGGPDHGIMFTSRFYSYNTEGHRLRDWVAAIAAGEKVQNVECTECSRPGLQFSAFDFQLLDRAIALISAPGAWLAQATTQPCLQQRTGPYSLTCAIQLANLELTGQTAPGYGLPAAFLEVIYTVAARMGNPPAANQGSAAAMLRAYNNRPGMTAQEVIGLLREVRDRVLASRRAR
jgi:Pectinacetylesterase